MILGGCLKGSLSISGDKEAVDAEIYVDGHKVGLMEKHVYVGSTSKDLEVLEREKRVEQRLGIKPGDIFSGTDIQVQSGTHEIMFVSKEGKKLKKVIKIQGEGYIAVDFEKMVIQGGDE
jgi:hypothetical protein